MSRFSLFRVEFSRLLRSPSCWLSTALTSLGLLGGFSYQGSTTMASMYLAQQLRSATLVGTVVFSIFTLYELSRVERNRTDAITDSIISPQRLASVRLLGILCASLLTTFLTAALYLPYAAWKLGGVFSLSDYLAGFLLFLLPALCFSALLSASCYQIVRRADVSFLAVLLFLILSRSNPFQNKFLWQWCLPMLPALSDDFSNVLVFRTAAYSRLVWLLFFLGLWLLSLLCIRRYGKGFLGSFLQGLRQGMLPALAVLLFSLGGILWTSQPFFDNSPVDWMAVQEIDHTQEGLSLLGTQVEIRAVSDWVGRMDGFATFQIQNTTGREQPLYFSLNTGYQVSRVIVNGVDIPFEDLEDDLIKRRTLRCTLPAEERVALRVEYGGVPQLWNISQTMLSGDLVSREEVQLNSTAFSPVPDLLIAGDTIPFQAQITLRDNLTPVASGFPSQFLRNNGDGTATWLLQDRGVNSMTVFAADYVKVDINGGGMAIEFYYSQKHQQQMTALGAIDALEAAIRYCTEHYGMRAFPEDRPFKIIQTTEFLFGGFAKQNISVISEASFTANNLSNPEKGASGAEVLAHEIIHQWWGLGAQLMDPEDPYWTDEGITTYTTYRLMKKERGQDYADQHYLDIWERDIAHNQNNFYIRHPEYLGALPEEYRVQLESETQSIMWYSGYARMFARAAELLGGDEALDQVLSHLYQNGGTEMPPYITQQDFLDASGLTKEDLGLA